MATAAARKAWNEAMKATAGASAVPPSLLKPQKRRSDRHKKHERRAKARKAVTSIRVDDEDAQKYAAAVWLDTLEGVDPNITHDEDEEYDELEELLDEKDSKRKRKRKSPKQKAGALPSRFLPRTLASILVEEMGRADGVATQFVQAEAHHVGPPLPTRKFCPVTGQQGIYTDPKSGIPYASLSALEQIRERPPPWMLLGGTAAYMEANASIRGRLQDANEV